MARTQADWHLPALPITTGDPLAAREPVEHRGVPIELGGRETKINARLVDLLRAEGRLFDEGVRCDIKERSDTCCHACPLQDRGELCEVGRQQETTLMDLAIAYRDRSA